MKTPSEALVDAVVQLEQGRLPEQARAELVRSLLRDPERTEGLLLAWRCLPAAERLTRSLSREEDRSDAGAGWWQLVYGTAAVGAIALAIVLGGRTPPVSGQVASAPADVFLLASFEPRSSDLFRGDFE